WGLEFLAIAGSPLLPRSLEGELMSRLLLLSAIGCITIASSAFLAEAQAPAPKRPEGDPSAKKPPASEPIDFERARAIMQKRRRGEKITAEEEAYLQKAIAAKQAGGGKAGPLTPRERTGLKPLDEMTATDRYKGQDGGLYGGGKNTPPEAHRRAAEAELARIR